MPLTLGLISDSLGSQWGQGESLMSYLAPREFKAISEPYLAKLVALAAICPD